MKEAGVQSLVDEGRQHHLAGRLKDAEAIYRRVLQSDPESPDALHLLGVIASQTGNPRGAAELITRAIAFNPGVAKYHNNLGIAHRNLGQPDAALADFDRALALQPDFAEAIMNRGNALKDRGRFDEALACYERTVTLKPAYPEGHYNLGTTLAEIGRVEEGIAYFDRLLREQPAMADAHWGLFVALMYGGEFARGWEEHEWRWEVNEFRSGMARRQFPQPVWTGGELGGRTILLHAEQGFGDTLQMIRYAPLVAARGGRVIVEAPPALASLLRTVRGVESVFETGARLPAFDLQAPIMSLPRIFRTTLETIPSEIPYISPPAGTGLLLEAPPGIRARVGLVWAGNPGHKNDRFRSIAIEHLQPLVKTPGVAFFSLQVGPRSGDVARLAPNVADLSNRLRDYATTAAALAQLDLLIAVDTSVAHLAGALARPVWTLLPFAPDWRWMLKRSDSPWYPTMRLFRQSTVGNWPSVIGEVTRELAKLRDAKG